MKAKKEVPKIKYESVKIKKEIVDLVRQHKKETYYPIGIFFEKAAEKELNSIKKSKPTNLNNA